MAESPDGYGDNNPTTAVIYDDSDYVDADSPVYVSGDGTNKFKMIKTLR
jgi:phage major head subunit gpT-like protein